MRGKRVTRDQIENMLNLLIYGKGLEDAWECVRKLYDIQNVSKVKEIFGSDANYVIHTCSASEAIQKIKEYEEKQKKNKCEPCNYRDVCSHDLDDYDCEPKPTDEIKVGDEIRSELTDTNAIVHRIDAWNRYQCITETGSQMRLDKDIFRKFWVKTGRHSDAIENILEQMKER